MAETWHIALFRGINVGKAKRVAMADLRAVVEGLGYGDARTLLNSGNLVFTAPSAAASKAATRIQNAVKTKCGVSSRVTVLTAAELSAIVKGNPLLKVASDFSRLFVTVLADPADKAKLQSLLKEKWAPDVLALGARVAYVWCPGGMLQSPLFEKVAKLLGDAVTTRNWATILKLQALVGDDK